MSGVIYWWKDFRFVDPETRTVMSLGPLDPPKKVRCKITEVVGDIELQRDVVYEAVEWGEGPCGPMYRIPALKNYLIYADRFEEVSEDVGPIAVTHFGQHVKQTEERPFDFEAYNSLKGLPGRK